MKTDKPILKILEEFLSDQEKAPGTLALYNKTIRYWIDWAVKADCDIKEIKKKDVIAYKAHLIAINRSAATIDNYISSLRVFYSWAVEEGYYQVNPAEGIGWLRDRQGMFIKSSLDLGQLNNLFNAVSGGSVVSKRNFALVKLMSFTGIRCVEAERLNKGDIKKARDRWLIQIRRKGYNEKGGVIAVTTEVISPILDYWKYRSGIISESDPVFVSHCRSSKSRDNRITSTRISKIIKAGLRSIGLDSRKYSAHSLRHSAATLAYQAGAETWEIQRMLGHTNPRQTEHYLHSLAIESATEGRAILKISSFVRKQKDKGKKRVKKNINF